jgi:hypothetical protein
VNWIIELVKLGIVGFIAGLFALYRAKQEFISQRWWERKADAYTRIIEALWQMLDYYKQNYEEITNCSKISDERKKEILKQWEQGECEINKVTDIGTFLVSEETITALKKIWEKPQPEPDPNDWFRHLENDYIATKACIETVIKNAKKDLQVIRGWHIIRQNSN